MVLTYIVPIDLRLAFGANAMIICMVVFVAIFWGSQSFPCQSLI